jgi:cytochrome oxidase assembly protein ShyY1
MTSGYRRQVIATLRQPRWLGLAAVTILMSVLFWWLGTWQWGRWEDRTARNEAMDAALAASPAPLASVVPDPAALSPGAEYRSITAAGQYSAKGQVLQRNPDGRSGYAILTPLVLQDGGTLLVERGFVPANPTDATRPAEDVTPPAGPVTVTARLRTPDEASDRTAPEGQVYAVTPSTILVGEPEPVYTAYGELVDQLPAPDPALELPVPPSSGWGPNLFYAIQWWMFIVIAVIGYVVLLRRESGAPHTPAEPESAPVD